MSRLRWKLDPREAGLRAVGAGPRGSTLHDGIKRYATVSAIGSGWYWVAGWGSGVPHYNSCNKPSPDEYTAKAEAMAYVKQHLSIPSQEVSP